jgi:hypothetical protein
MASLLNDPNIVSAWKKARNKANITKAWNPFKHHAKVGSKLQDWQGALRDFRYELQESLKDSAKDDESSVKAKDLKNKATAKKVYFSEKLQFCISDCVDKLENLKSALNQMDGKVREVRKERAAKKDNSLTNELDAFEQLIEDLLKETLIRLVKWKGILIAYNSKTYAEMPYDVAAAKINGKLGLS